MANVAADALKASHPLEKAGVATKQPDTIVEVVNQSASQMVIAERFKPRLKLVSPVVWNGTRARLARSRWRFEKTPRPRISPGLSFL